MPKPTLQNRKYFKSYLKRYRDRFTSGIQTCQVSDISGMFSSSSAGLSTNQSVKVLLFGGNDYDDEIQVGSEFGGGSLVYFPASSGDYVNLDINSFRYQLYFSSEDGGITFEGTTYGLDSTFNVGSKSLTVKALGGALVETQDGPTYSVGISTTTIDEGSSVTFTVNTTGISTGTTLYYTTNGPVSTADFLDNSLTGSFVINNNVGTIIRTLVDDDVFDYEDFYLEIRTSSTNGSIVAESDTITIINKDYYVGVSTTSIDEGGSVNITVNTINVQNGTTLYYSTVGIVSASDFTDNSLTGSFIINSSDSINGIATITRTLSNDLSSIESEGEENFQIQIRKTSTTGTIVATSSTITVNDTSFSSYTLTQSSTTVSEGSSVDFTLTTVGVPTGTTLYYTTTNTTDVNPTSGSFVVNSGISTFTINVLEDTEVDAGESFYAFVRTSSTSGDIVGISSEVTITNTTSYTVLTSKDSVSEGEDFTITINSSGIPDGSTLYYTSTSPNDILPASGSVVVSGGTTSFTLIAKEDLLVESSETFQIQIRSGSTSGNVVGISSSISLLNTTSFEVTESINTINEGENVTFTVNTIGVPDGTNLYYTTTPSGESSPTSGSFSIISDTGSFVITANSDFNVEPNESFQVQIRTVSESGGIVTTSNSITIADVPYSLAIESNANVVEGDFINFTVNTTGIADATTLYYTTAGISTADMPIQSGSFTIFNNRGTFSLLPVKDLAVDDNETFTVQIRVGSISGTIIATSSVINIDDFPYTITVTPSATTIIESTAGSTSTISFNIVTTNIEDGIQLNARIVSTDGNITASDFTPSNLERSFTLSGYSASFAWNLTRDVLTEGTEKFILQILDTGNNVIAVSPEIIVTDGSFIGSRYDGKIHGPIRVNRDGGNTAQISDWFSICDLDQLPEGSKIALFVDNSGSMTTATVQASYNAFIEKINEKNMDIIVVTNDREDWINPFNTILD
jgi:hypothetical protein